ncbi:unnamed protein product [Mytilus coruscus]|uniref:HAT C-terminal dimerisation domain-containing protein n=1 Tax=Mytilus coruscus TaxID=42192 RepID=A0A6J8BNQ7_MYTCO|nr:unnamed protein product [Mytilus coruscus]
MRKRQKLFGLRQNELIQDVVTRWNSTQQMLERLCEQRRVITDVMLDTTVTKKSDTQMLLKDHEWDYLVEISEVLKQMSHVTTYMCLEKDVSASVMLPIVHGLLKKHLKNSEEDSALAHKMKASISEELITRFKPYNIETASTQHALASLLDPRHRTLNFFSPEQKKVAIEMLESKLDDVPLKPAVKKSSTNLGTEVDKQPAKKQRVQRSLDFLLFDTDEDKSFQDESEMSLYIKERAAQDSNPLEWWKENNCKFPRLSVLARQYLTSNSDGTVLKISALPENSDATFLKISASPESEVATKPKTNLDAITHQYIVKTKLGLEEELY